MSDLDQYEADTRDVADAFVILDGHDVKLAVCTTCGFALCECCTICHSGPRPCACDDDAISQRESRAMVARADGGPSRYGRRG